MGDNERSEVREKEEKREKRRRERRERRKKREKKKEREKKKRKKALSFQVLISYPMSIIGSLFFKNFNWFG